MKLFVFFSLVFVLIPFTHGQVQKHEEIQALINENNKHNPEIAAEQSRVEMMKEQMPQISQQDILRISMELAEIRSDEGVIRQGSFRQDLSKPDSINNITSFRQVQCDFILLVKL
jgi:hypothetical protein